MRRYLDQSQLVRRRSRPILSPHHPDYEQKVRKLKHLLNELPDGEIALFQEEVEVCTNPKIDSKWMPQGEQATVQTPGNNEKHHLIGSLAWHTCRLVTTWAERRSSAAFYKWDDYFFFFLLNPGLRLRITYDRAKPGTGISHPDHGDQTDFELLCDWLTSPISFGGAADMLTVAFFDFFGL